MYFQPARPNPGKQLTAQMKFIPPPIGGWNAKDALSDMEPEDAVLLDNFIPTEGGIITRKGYAEHSIDITGTVRTLMEYAPPSGSTKLFAAVTSTIYDASTSGASASSSLSSLTNSDWQHTMFATSGNNYLVICNGVDTVRHYNGSVWAAPSITGVTSSNLINVASHMERLWFVEKDTLKIWYLPTGSVAGAATKIDFGGYSKLGGKLVAMASWTRDGGSGVDDVAVFITSKGEAHLYSGIDPANAATWERLGTFRIPEPVGYRCVIKTGGDVGILTSAGLVPLSAILPLAASGQSKVAATERIGNAFSSAYAAAASSFGWQAIEATKDKLLIVNIPILAGSTFHQYVMNSVTGKWCRFKGLSASCWAVRDGELYFGGSGKVYKYTGSTDLGAAIQSQSVSAFNNFGTNNSKTFKRIRPQFFGETGYKPRVGLRLDYDENTVSYSAPAPSAQGEKWDEAIWDVAVWAKGSAPSSRWQSARGEGFAAATLVQMSSTERVTYNGSKVLFGVGDQL